MNVNLPPFDNVKVRQAANFAVDRTAVAKIIGGDLLARPTSGILALPMIPDDLDKEPYPAEPDLEKAKALIAESGVATPIKLATVVWNVPPYPDYAQAVQATAAQAGIDLDLQVVDGGPWLDRYRSHDLDIWFGLWGPDYPDPHSNAKAFTVNDKVNPDGSHGNLADRFGWDSGELSDEVLAAVQEQDTEKRKEMYDSIQRRHTDRSPFVYMFQDSRKVAMRSNVKGVVLGITFSDDRYGAVTKQ
jgi:peptide/nickel transport system substrate-binding protein